MLFLHCSKRQIGLVGGTVDKETRLLGLAQPLISCVTLGFTSCVLIALST
jgi:hypothetical protein